MLTYIAKLFNCYFFQVVSNHAMLVLMFKYNYVLYSGVKDFVKSNYLTFNKAKTILELQDEVLGEYGSKSLIYIRAIY